MKCKFYIYESENHHFHTENITLREPKIDDIYLLPDYEEMQNKAKYRIKSVVFAFENFALTRYEIVNCEVEKIGDN